MYKVKIFHFLMLLLLWSSSPTMAQQTSFIDLAIGVKLTPHQSEILSGIKSLSTTQKATIVRLNIEALRDGNQISIPLDSKSVSIQNSSRQSSDDNTLWYGTAPNETAGSTAIVANKQTVTGLIPTEDGLYQIRPLGDGLHALVKVNAEKLPPEHPITGK